MDLSPDYGKRPLGLRRRPPEPPGDPDLVELQLYWLKKNKISNILVHDDSSSAQERLIELCARYGAEFVSTPKKLYYQKNFTTLRGPIGIRGAVSSGRSRRVWTFLSS